MYKFRYDNFEFCPFIVHHLYPNRSRRVEYPERHKHRQTQTLRTRQSQHSHDQRIRKTHRYYYHHQFIHAEIDLEENLPPEVEKVQADEVDAWEQRHEWEHPDEEGGVVRVGILQNEVAEHAQHELVDDKYYELEGVRFDAPVRTGLHEFLELLVVLLKMLEVGLIPGIRQLVHYIPYFLLIILDVPENFLLVFIRSVFFLVQNVTVWIEECRIVLSSILTCNNSKI